MVQAVAWAPATAGVVLVVWRCSTIPVRGIGWKHAILSPVGNVMGLGVAMGSLRSEKPT